MTGFHPYLEIWLGCKYWSDETTRTLPESGGWLEWDAGITRAMQLIDELYREAKADKERFEKAHDAPAGTHLN